MAEHARVTSVEALESFRASLIVFLSKARPALEEAGEEVTRVRDWLERDRRQHWDAELRRRQRRLEEAEQELFSAKLSQLLEETAAQTQAVRLAKRAVEEAESKRERVRRWTREFENRTDPLTRQVGLTLGFVTTELGRAVRYLGQAIETLEAYANVASPQGAASIEERSVSGPVNPDGTERSGVGDNEAGGEGVDR
jgi:hypothetical protein